MSDWWYADKQKKTGPVTEADLRRLLQAGEIDLSTMAWQEGMKAWQPLSKIEALSSLCEALPPPLPQKKEINPATLPIATRWPRFFARTFDMCWETILIAYIAGLILGHYSAWYIEWINKPGASIWYGLLCLPVAMLFDAALYAIFGNTPGKALLGLTVTNLDGSALSFGQYTTRNYLCWASGYAFGLPFINLITMYKQSKIVHKGLPASYDEGLDIRVHARHFSSWRIILFILLFTGLLGLIGHLKNIENTFQGDLLTNKQESYSWENPITNVSISIEANWKNSSLSDKENQRVYMFNELTDHAAVFFAEEKSDGNITLDDYVRAFMKRNKPNMFFADGGRYSQMEGYPIWQCTGQMTNINYANRMNVQIDQRGASFWRLVSIQTMPYDYSDAMLHRLERALWSTVKYPFISNQPVTTAPTKSQQVTSNGMLKFGGFVLDVSEEVKATWSAVKLHVDDKVAKRSKDYIVAIGSALAIPNTKVIVKVLAFLPDYKYDGKSISTSASNRPNNPAALIVVQEPGAAEWTGFIYSLHPEIHPYQHNKIAVTLTDGVMK